MTVWAFGTLLIVLTIGALYHRGAPIIRTALALLVNWGAGYVHFRLTGDYTPWAWWLFTDTIMAFIILLNPAGRIQAFIGVTYLVAIALHAAYGIHLSQGYSYTAQLHYWGAIQIIAYVQVALLGGWIGGGFLHNRPSRHYHFRARIPYPQGTGKTR